MGRRKKSGNFIDESQLLSLWNQWKNSAAEIQDRAIPDQLVALMYKISDHLLEHPRFVRYPQHMKDDMRQDAVLKCVRNLKNFNSDKGKLFSYFTTCCWTAFVVYLSKHYKEVNHKRKLVVDALNSLDEKQIGSKKFLHELLEDLQETVSEYSKTGKLREKDEISENFQNFIPPENF